MPPRTTRPIAEQEARLALRDPIFEAYAFCRPDSKLGILD
ncbi:DUF6233 domain-containing protein [Streptomyces hygroscopicus]|nr:DUF6233 domain-containing protein [Streptomyces hygroscopicus]